MSDRSKNFLATVAVIGIAAVASSQALTARTAPQQQVAVAASLVPASFNR